MMCHDLFIWPYLIWGQLKFLAMQIYMLCQVWQVFHYFVANSFNPTVFLFSFWDSTKTNLNFCVFLMGSWHFIYFCFIYFQFFRFDDSFLLSSYLIILCVFPFNHWAHFYMFLYFSFLWFSFLNKIISIFYFFLFFRRMCYLFLKLLWWLP